MTSSAFGILPDEPKSAEKDQKIEKSSDVAVEESNNT
jgi:hypothetical protein